MPVPARRSRLQFLVGCIGLVLVAAAVLLATVTAGKEWVPPLELSVAHDPSGQSVATVTWGSTVRTDGQLEIVAGSSVLWSSPVPRDPGTQSLALPSGILRPGTRVVLVSNGQPLREVDG